MGNPSALLWGYKISSTSKDIPVFKWVFKLNSRSQIYRIGHSTSFWNTSNVTLCLQDNNYFLVSIIINATVRYLYELIWFFSSDYESQVERLKNRNGFSQSDAEQRIKAQMDLSKKCEQSHFVIDNSGSFDETRTQVLKVLNYIQSSNHHIVVRLYLFIFAGLSFLALCFILVKTLM